MSAPTNDPPPSRLQHTVVGMFVGAFFMFFAMVALFVLSGPMCTPKASTFDGFMVAITLMTGLILCALSIRAAKHFDGRKTEGGQ